MKVIRMAIATMALSGALAAQQQPATPQANPVAGAFKGRILGSHRNIAQAFDSIPESKFGYKPTPAQLSFGYIAQHIADVYIAARTLHLATLSACWRLAAGLDAGADLDVAAYWLAEHGPAAMRTCHHLHGGTGMDVSYPLARLSALVKDLARYAGGASYTLDRLGDRV